MLQGQWQNKLVVATGQTQPVALSGSPACVVFGNSLLVFHSGTGPKINQLFCFAFDGTHSSDQQIFLDNEPIGIADAVSAVVLEGCLYVFFTGVGDRDGQLCCLSSPDGATWTAIPMEPNGSPIDAAGAPAAVTFTESSGATAIYVFHLNPSGDVCFVVGSNES